MSTGLTDKLYWRQARPGAVRIHCFEPARDGRKRYYRALCDDQITRQRSSGQGIARPPAYARCAICDGAEMKRRGWDESGPESHNWRDFL